MDDADDVHQPILPSMKTDRCCCGGDPFRPARDRPVCVSWRRATCWWLCCSCSTRFPSRRGRILFQTDLTPRYPVTGLEKKNNLSLWVWIPNLLFFQVDLINDSSHGQFGECRLFPLQPVKTNSLLFNDQLNVNNEKKKTFVCGQIRPEPDEKVWQKTKQKISYLETWIDFGSLKKTKGEVHCSQDKPAECWPG